MAGDGDQAEWNDAVNYLNRINQLFSQVDQAIMSVNAHRWLYSLQPLANELSNYMSDEDKKKLNGNEKEKSEGLFVQALRLMQTFYHNDSKILPELWKVLQEITLIVHGAYAKSGLQMKQKTDPRLRR